MRETVYFKVIVRIALQINFAQEIEDKYFP